MRAKNHLGASVLPRSRKGRALLAYLSLINGDRVPRTRLAGMLWERVSEEQARTSLRQVVRELVQALGPSANDLIAADRESISLNVSKCWIDVAVVLSRSNSTVPGEVEIVDPVGVSSSQLLEDLYGASAAFDQWILGERARFDDKVRGLYEANLRTAAKMGAPDQCAAIARRLIQFDPTHEEGWRVLMRALAEIGDYGKALREYDRCSDALKRELDLPPSRETRVLRDAIRAVASRPLSQTGVSTGLTDLIDLVPKAADKLAEAIERIEDPTPSLQPDLATTASDALKSWAPLPLPQKPSIAVLPFTNMSGDAEQEYFVDGMVEEIITALSRIKWLFVIARNSTFTYKGQAVDVRQIGRELGVRYVLEGSVRKAGARVRITAQLIDAANGTHLWADRFDGSLEDVFELQDQVALSVAGVIEPALQAAETALSVARSTIDLTAHDVYLRAYAMLFASPKQVAQALELLEQAITREPHYGPALACAAICCVRLVWDGLSVDPESDTRKGTDYARLAVQVAGDDPATLAQAAPALAQFGEDIGAMIALVDRALELNPSFARGWQISSQLRLFAGEIDVAIEHAEAASRLSPRGRVGGLFNVIGSAHFFGRRFDEAVPNLLLAIQERPNYPLPYRILAACYAHMGRLEDAHKIVARLRAITPLIVPSVVNWRNLEHRELYLSGLRLASDEPDWGCASSVR
jgi:TolB-like protein/DNA-binding SARP family transcriptional activator